LSHWGHFRKFCFEQILYFNILYNFCLLLELKITRCGALNVFAMSLKPSRQNTTQPHGRADFLFGRALPLPRVMHAKIQAMRKFCK
jgi:hypothetical protein